LPRSGEGGSGRGVLYRRSRHAPHRKIRCADFSAPPQGGSERKGESHRPLPHFCRNWTACEMGGGSRNGTENSDRKHRKRTRPHKTMPGTQISGGNIGIRRRIRSGLTPFRAFLRNRGVGGPYVRNATARLCFCAKIVRQDRARLSHCFHIGMPLLPRPVSRVPHSIHGHGPRMQVQECSPENACPGLDPGCETFISGLHAIKTYGGFSYALVRARMAA
jgi:hypothetical protein